MPDTNDISATPNEIALFRTLLQFQDMLQHKVAKDYKDTELRATLEAPPNKPARHNKLWHLRKLYGDLLDGVQSLV